MAAARAAVRVVAKAAVRVVAKAAVRVGDEMDVDVGGGMAGMEIGGLVRCSLRCVRRVRLTRRRGAWHRRSRTALPLSIMKFSRRHVRVKKKRLERALRVRTEAADGGVVVDAAVDVGLRGRRTRTERRRMRRMRFRWMQRRSKSVHRR